MLGRQTFVPLVTGLQFWPAAKHTKQAKTRINRSHPECIAKCEVARCESGH